MHSLRHLIVALVLLVSTPAAAYEIKISDESNVNIDFLLQTWAQFTEDGSTSKDTWSKDLFIRRARLLVFGKVNKAIGFFMETEQANWGKNGDWSSSMFIQDAFATFTAIEDALNVDVGMILLPFSRHNTQGAVGLNAIDYHTAVIKFPDGSHKVWRDIGVQLRGYLLDKKLQYRAGVFSGSQGVALEKTATGATRTASNPDDLPRVTGRVQYNILGTEADLFGKGIYFAKEPIVSVGIGTDFVPDSVLATPARVNDVTGETLEEATLDHHVALAVDAFADIPLGESHEVVGQLSFFYYDQGKDKPASGWALLSELGYRYEQVELVVGYDHFASDVEASEYQAALAGVNFWILPHKASIKSLYTHAKTGGANGKWLANVALQAQLYF